MTAQCHTFSLDAELLAVLMWNRVGARLRQQVLWGACDPVFTLGVLGAQGAGCDHALYVPAERTVAGSNSLSHRAARHYWVLFGAAYVHKTQEHNCYQLSASEPTWLYCMCQTISIYEMISLERTIWTHEGKFLWEKPLLLKLGFPQNNKHNPSMDHCAALGSLILGVESIEKVTLICNKLSRGRITRSRRATLNSRQRLNKVT